MAEKNEYRARLDASRMDKLRDMQKELPIVCTGFFRSISQTTSTLTRLAYAYDFRLFFGYLCAESPQFGQKASCLINESDLDRITGHDIEGYQDYLMQYYKSTEDGQVLVQNHELGIMRKLSSIRSLFDYLYRNKIVTANVTTLISLPKLHDKPILRLEADEMEKMLNAASTGQGLTARQQAYQKATQVRDYAMLMLFLGTGIRVSECVGINLSDIDFSMNGFVVTRKGGNQTILYFPQAVADALQAYVKIRESIEAMPGNEDALFLSLQRKRITQRAVENLVKKYALIAAPLKQRISPHKLRSTFGTNLYLETGDIYLVADVLGHSDVNTTRKHYAAMTEAKRKEAVRHIHLPADSLNPEKK